MIHQLNRPRSRTRVETAILREQLASSWLTRTMIGQELMNPFYKRLQFGAWPWAERISHGLVAEWKWAFYSRPDWSCAPLTLPGCTTPINPNAVSSTQHLSAFHDPTKMEALPYLLSSSFHLKTFRSSADQVFTCSRTLLSRSCLSLPAERTRNPGKAARSARIERSAAMNTFLSGQHSLSLSFWLC